MKIPTTFLILWPGKYIHVCLRTVFVHAIRLMKQRRPSILKRSSSPSFDHVQCTWAGVSVGMNVSMDTENMRVLASPSSALAWFPYFTLNRYQLIPMKMGIVCTHSSLVFLWPFFSSLSSHRICRIDEDGLFSQGCLIQNMRCLVVRRWTGVAQVTTVGTQTRTNVQPMCTHIDIQAQREVEQNTGIGETVSLRSSAH